MEIDIRKLPLISQSTASQRSQEYLGGGVSVKGKPFDLVCSQCNHSLFNNVTCMGQSHEKLICTACKSTLDPASEYNGTTPLPDHSKLKEMPSWKAGYPLFSTLGEMSEDGLEALNDIHKIFRRKSLQVPRILYHYTTNVTFQSIVDNESIWITPIAEMNDRTEGSYGVDFLNSYLKQKASSLHATSFKQPKQGSLHRDSEEYAFCLCDEKDELGLWREYGEKGTGVAIGFDSYALARNKFWIVQQIYSSEEQSQILTDTLALAEPFLCEYGPTNPSSTADKIQISMAIKQEASLIFKHPAFRDEREWRIVTNPNGGNGDLKYRTSKLGPISYLETGRGQQKHWDVFPVVNVVCGPSRDSLRSRLNMIRYLESKSMGHIQVDSSEVPLK